MKRPGTIALPELDVAAELRAQRPGWRDRLLSRVPLPVIAARTIDLGGFELRAAPSHRHVRAPDPDGDGVSRLRRALRFDDYELTHNDLGLTGAWLDGRSCDALTRTLWMARTGTHDEVDTVVEGAIALLAGDEVVVTPRSLAKADLELAAAAAAALATAPRRLATRLAAEVRPLGLSPTGAVWSLDEDFALTGGRDGVMVRIDYRRDRGAVQTRFTAGDVEVRRDGVLRTRAELIAALDVLVGPHRASAHPYR